MFLLAAGNGKGYVSSNGLSARMLASTLSLCDGHRPPTDVNAAAYHFETWLKVGGFKTTFGWIESEPHLLDSLLPAAEVFLVLEDGRTIQIELTDVQGSCANVRFPGDPPVF